jgi:hypothetical protein
VAAAQGSKHPCLPPAVCCCLCQATDTITAASSHVQHCNAAATTAAAAAAAVVHHARDAVMCCCCRCCCFVSAATLLGSLVKVLNQVGDICGHSTAQQARKTHGCVPRRRPTAAWAKHMCQDLHGAILSLMLQDPHKPVREGRRGSRCERYLSCTAGSIGPKSCSEPLALAQFADLTQATWPGLSMRGMACAKGP